MISGILLLIVLLPSNLSMRLFAPLTRTIEESLSSARYAINSALEDYAKAIEESMEELTETMLGVRAFEEGEIYILRHFLLTMLTIMTMLTMLIPFLSF